MEFKGILPDRLIRKKVINNERIRNLVTLALTIDLKPSINDCFKIE